MTTKPLPFHIHQGLKWTDGKAFTSADCIFTLKLIQADSTQSAYKSDYALVTDVKAPDPAYFCRTLC